MYILAIIVLDIIPVHISAIVVFGTSTHTAMLLYLGFIYGTAAKTGGSQQRLALDAVWCVTCRAWVRQH